MSSYFDFTIERKHDNKWICVAESHYDDLDIINPWILKGAFWDAEFTKDINSLDETELSDESFYMFSRKLDEINSKDRLYYIGERTNRDVIGFLEHMNKTRYRNNDVCLWFNLVNICKHKEFLKNVLYPHNQQMSNWEIFRDKIDNITEDSDFIEIFQQCDNLILITFDNMIGIIFHENPYSMINTIKYSPFFKNVEIYNAQLLGYYEDDNITEKKQYDFYGKVSYKKDIENMISEINKTLQRIENSKKSEEIAKSYISDILSDYEYDESMKNNELYKRLYEYSKDSEEYDEEYEDELLAQKKELEFILRFIGDNGRLIWKIE